MMKYLKRAWFIFIAILLFLPFAISETVLGILAIARGDYDDSPWIPPT